MIDTPDPRLKDLRGMGRGELLLVPPDLAVFTLPVGDDDRGIIGAPFLGVDDEGDGGGGTGTELDDMVIVDPRILARPLRSYHLQQTPLTL